MTAGENESVRVRESESAKECEELRGAARECVEVSVIMRARMRVSVRV